VEMGPGGAASGRGAACEAAGGDTRWQQRAKRYGEGPMPCGSATTQLSIAAVEILEKGQVVWPGTRARWSTTLSADGCCC
jgi:hypothetical protein